MNIKEFLKENYATTGLWIILFFVIWIQIIPQTESIVEATIFAILLLVTAFPFTTYLSRNLLLKAIKNRDTITFVLQFLFISAIIGALFVCLLFAFSFLEQKGIFPKSEYFDMNVPVVMFLVPISAGIAINLTLCGIRFFQENTRLKKTLLEYQLRTLQHQVTPHFMFNVLNHIHILMQTDVNLASDLLIRYSEILRYQLYNGDKQYVTLDQDIQFLKDFIAIEEMRWIGKLEVKSEWKIENPQKEIPSLLFITLIENAFKHVAKSDMERGYISISFEQKADVLALEVENSKSTFKKKDARSHGLGLKNLKERLDILYFGKYKFAVKESQEVYYTKLVINM